jgi:toxin ParE1/3/4
MITEIIIRAEAEQDIIEAFSWYNDRLPGLGHEFVNSVDSTIQSILNNPEICPIIYRNIRRSLIKHFPYAVYFIHAESSIIVLAVFHFKRNPRNWRKRQ